MKNIVRVVASPIGRLALVALFGAGLGAVAGQERTIAACPKDICEQDIIWDDCIDSPDPTSNNECNMVAGECHNQTCPPLEES